MDMYEPIHVGTGFYRSPRPGPPPDWAANEGDAEFGDLPTPRPRIGPTDSPDGGGGNGKGGNNRRRIGPDPNLGPSMEEGLDEQERRRLEEIERRVQSYEMRPAVGVSLPELGKTKAGVDGGEDGGPDDSEMDLGLELDEEAEQVVAEWLREKIEEDLGRNWRGRGR